MRFIVPSPKYAAAYGSSLKEIYCYGCLEEASQVFDEMPLKDIKSD